MTLHVNAALAAALLFYSVAAIAQDDVARRTHAAAKAIADGRPLEALAELRAVTEQAPERPQVWYALGQAYNAIKEDAIRSFEAPSEDPAWRQLILADALAEEGSSTDAFVLYRQILERLPSMVSIHDAVARIYQEAGHAAWAAEERAKAARNSVDCAARRPFCEFAAGRSASALAHAFARSDPESRYWRARAAAALALDAFARLEGLADSRERRAVRAARARAEKRYTDAIRELQAALTFSRADPALIYELVSSFYLARNFEEAAATGSALLRERPDPRLLKLVAYSLLQLRRLDEAVPLLQQAVGADSNDPGPRLALGRAYVQSGNFAAAVPLLEAHLAGDHDGSLHVQLARAYIGVGRRQEAASLLERSRELQRAEQERSRAAAQRTLTPP